MRFCWCISFILKGSFWPPPTLLVNKDPEQTLTMSLLQKIKLQFYPQLPAIKLRDSYNKFASYGFSQLDNCPVLGRSSSRTVGSKQARTLFDSVAFPHKHLNMLLLSLVCIGYEYTPVGKIGIVKSPLKLDFLPNVFGEIEWEGMDAALTWTKKKSKWYKSVLTAAPKKRCTCYHCEVVPIAAATPPQNWKLPIPKHKCKQGTCSHVHEVLTVFRDQKTNCTRTNLCCGWWPVFMVSGMLILVSREQMM